MKKILLITIGLSVGLMAAFVRDANTSIVTDNATALQWQDDAPALMTWQLAIDYCEALTLGGQSDWRVPNINELNSLVDDTLFNPAINPAFLNTISNGYWSSTTLASSTATAWLVYFDDGGQGGNGKANNDYVRCVRAGQ